MIEGIKANSPSQQRSVHLVENKSGSELEKARENEKNENMLKQQDAVKLNEIKEVVKGINEFLQPSHSSLKFVFHEKLEEYYVSIIDEQTKEVIKEIPSKEMLDYYAAMTEKLGFLIDKKI
ncbi:hypothetical protein ABE29_18785 [Cytobacillus firmus]|uniref:flagellar protein FlaG n=1 Tax=Cytobacillus firmus TaxID=1399 RepID=UPI00077C75C1|nr:flagellar protein FlaG [Cytobacillus firmus]MBG9544729.1 hypothetical protein [Cytobacillus firmus]MBG9553992.1 hypothetical protein [Cytobacillus firmus]MBG9558476.1 hypothetical protein [Cytobacillus firmus]MBG9576981.1 hypothetical protein [Cytobacillus firmus]MEC1894367.1 flagellar protein FlaG [Cytobacillus firmus]